MKDKTVQFYPPRSESDSVVDESEVRLEPATCTEAESFVLQVLDDTMEPEFRRGCMIVIDPTGRATDGSFVLARRVLSGEDSNNPVDDYVFRQLRRTSESSWQLHTLNPVYQDETSSVSLQDIVGVIVQRAGVRRSYHKRYN